LLAGAAHQLTGGCGAVRKADLCQSGPECKRKNGKICI
jgi:hypothetical protein